MTIGKRLREFRERAGLSQAQLAKVAGVSRNAVSQWEADVTQPSTRRLSAVARALNVPVDRIMTTNSQLRETIVSTAARLFERLGYEETSIEIICASADVSMDDLAAAFDSKHDLLYEVMRTYRDRTFAELRRLPPKFGPLDARLKQLVHTYYVHDLAHAKLISAIQSYSWQWDATREREAARNLSEHHEMVVELFNEAAADGQIASGNFRAASALVLGAYTLSLRKAVFEEFDASRLMAYIEPQLMLILKGLGWKDPSAGKAS